MNPFDIKDVTIIISVKCEHQLSGITVQIERERDKASLLDMRAEALNEIEFLVANSPRYKRILKDAEKSGNDTKPSK
jgi:hypothetical protein